MDCLEDIGDMRVYKRGKKIPIRELRWADLCHPGTLVRWDLDEHIPVWPDHIVEEQNKAPDSALTCLGLRV